MVNRSSLVDILKRYNHEKADTVKQKKRLGKGP